MSHYKKTGKTPKKRTGLCILLENLSPDRTYTEEEIKQKIDELATNPQYEESIKRYFNANLKSNFKTFGVINGFFEEIQNVNPSNSLNLNNDGPDQIVKFLQEKYKPKMEYIEAKVTSLETEENSVQATLDHYLKEVEKQVEKYQLKLDEITKNKQLLKEQSKQLLQEYKALNNQFFKTAPTDLSKAA